MGSVIECQHTQHDDKKKLRSQVKNVQDLQQTTQLGEPKGSTAEGRARPKPTVQMHTGELSLGTVHTGWQRGTSPPLALPPAAVKILQTGQNDEEQQAVRMKVCTVTQKSAD